MSDVALPPVLAPENPPPVAPWPDRDDFPDRWPAMLVKELRQGLRTRGFVGLLIVFHLIMVIAFAWTLEITTASGLRGAYDTLNGFFWTLLGFGVLLVTPMRGLASLREEVDARTMELLVLTHLTSWRIVTGKWLSLVVQALLLVLTALPYAVVRYFFGSVDLGSDLLYLFGLLFTGGMLTAAAMWVSTMPKVFRVLLPLVLFFLIQGAGMARVFAGGARGGGPSTATRALLFIDSAWTFAFGVIALVFFLVLAVRRLAPPAENHAVFTRGLGLAAFLVGGVAGSSSLAGAGTDYAVAGLVIMGLAMAFEMAEDRLPMVVHMPAWTWRHATTRLLGKGLLPGWPSAALFAIGPAVFLAVSLVLFTPFLGAEAVARYLWCIVLGWQALLFPALVLSILPRNSSLRLNSGGYFVIQGLFSIVSIFSASAGLAAFGMQGLSAALEWLSSIFPVTSFWLSLVAAGKRPLSAGEITGQLLALAAVLAFAWWRSAPYRARLAQIESRPRRPAS